MNKQTEGHLLKKGVMYDDPFKMTIAEERDWQAIRQARTRERVFAAGQALVYEWRGRMVAEYPDNMVDIVS
ncbi:hypothetical protein FO440_23825 [Mucilaginibacter corticis]|uniref:Uncharacterized protein n=1 Tax=Mucilaginibacter corticis TaxID=2597670 RepID=A0A556M7Q4_9SPHI|nr:hypothetical protein [Mucilaginibacter corticis]TSJ35950.1 hypothetical protein FO440_23825 [Mucilaginibacter corticis]